MANNQMKKTSILSSALALIALLGSAAQAQVALNPGDRTWLQTTIASGTLADLRWPNFSDYSKHLQKFYDFNGAALWWVNGTKPTPQALQVIALLQQAGRKGLSPDDYDGPRWSDRLARLKPAISQPSPQDAVKFDLALTICVMRYISDLHIGKVNPKRLAFELDDESKKYDLPEFLRDHVAGASDVAAELAQVEPPYPGYRRTLRAFQSYVELAKQDDGEQLPPPAAPKKVVAPGDTWPGVSRLARLLRLVGDLPADANLPADQSIYDGPLVDAVKSFQRRHGRDADGRIGAQTLADLNVPLSRRVEQMQWTLERWRWLPDLNRKAPIVVNIPEFRLRAYDENFNVGLTMNVVVGRAYGHSTPVFSENMQYLIFRPYWDVPASITRGEIVPHLQKDPDYLAKDRLQIVDSRRNPVSSGPVTSDTIDQLRAGKLFIRQIPGPKNSLGLVVFLFPNSYAIYMHDTPAPEFFAQSRRDFSHGCIRLEKPADMAAWVLRDKPDWTAERIRAAMQNGPDAQQVNLAHPIQVLIMYATVVVQDDGTVHFYDDIYGHDAALQKVLAKGYPYPW
jgi:murein L,D-transpeptidase YcbB/YkuD